MSDARSDGWHLFKIVEFGCHLLLHGISVVEFGQHLGLLLLHLPCDSINHFCLSVRLVNSMPILVRSVLVVVGVRNWAGLLRPLPHNVEVLHAFVLLLSPLRFVEMDDCLYFVWFFLNAVPLIAFGIHYQIFLLSDVWFVQRPAEIDFAAVHFFFLLHFSVKVLFHAHLFRFVDVHCLKESGPLLSISDSSLGSLLLFLKFDQASMELRLLMSALFHFDLCLHHGSVGAFQP